MPIVSPSTRRISLPRKGISESVRYPWAMVLPNGPCAAFSASTWIHWWSPVASANWSICSWVTVCHAPWPRCSPLTAASSSRLAKIRMGASVLWPAGHVDHLAGHESGLVADKERRQGGDVLGLPDPPHGDRGRRAVLELLEVHPDPRRGGRGHLGLDEPGGDGVGRDPE